MVSGPIRVQRVIKFGEDFELDLRAFELRRAGRPLKLERIPLQILVFLIEHNQELVTREEIIEQVWGKDVFLDTDNSINGAIRKIRQALRDDPEQPRFIQTITGLGYRFIAEVVENGHEPPLSQAPLRDGSNGHAVLPQPRTATSRLSLRVVLACFAVLFAVAILVVAVVLTRNHPLPFQTVKTVRVTSAGQSGKAAISPDGSYIAHTVISSGHESLRLRRANMLSDVELVPPQEVHYLGLTFSPDSQSVYFVTQKTGDEPGTLYRVSVIGGSPQKINEHLDSSISFSPDGKKYAFVRESVSTSTLLIADLDSGTERPIISRKLPKVLDYPGWSPDGRTIAFTDTDSSVASPRGSNARLMQVQLSDSREAVLSSQTWGFLRDLVWVHDQRGLVISARSPEESGFFHLWYVPYPDGIARQITEGIYRQRGVSISADSRQIVTVQESAFSSIWRVRSLRNLTPEPVVSGESGTSAPVWTKSGRIVFEEELNGRRSIFSVNADGTNRKELTGTGNNYDASVSGNGELLAFVSDRSGTPAIWTMDLESGKSQLLTKATGEPIPQLSTDATGAAVPQLSPDGTWIAFTAIGSGHWTTLWRIPSVGGQAKELNDKFWLRPLISPDGDWIAGFYDDGQLNTQTKPTSIAVISSNGGTPQKVFHIPFSVVVSGGIRWSRDGRALCYINSGKGGSNIWEQPISGGPPRQITSFEGVDLFSFDWSPDGKQLTFSRGLQARDVVLVEDIRRK